MNPFYRKKNLTCLLTVAISFVVPSTVAEANETPQKKLMLSEFLSQVKENAAGIKGQVTLSEAGQKRSEEGAMLLAPTLYADAKYSSDGKLPQFSFIAWDAQTSKTFSLGVSKLTTFGMNAKLHYDVTQLNLVNLGAAGSLQGTAFAGLGAAYPTSYVNASPILELTQNFWNNGFGSSTRANQEKMEADALSSSFNASYQAKNTLVQAEVAYWDLAMNRQLHAMFEASLERARLIYEWNQRRARMQLTDISDAIQAEATMKTRELDVLTAKNTIRSASRTFNSARFRDADNVPEDLVDLTPAMIDEIKPPTRVGIRDDVKAAEQTARSSRANAEVSIQKNAPSLDLTASFALNGQVGSSVFNDIGTSMANSFSFGRPTASVALHFSMPLNFGTWDATKEGWALEKIGAEKNYDQKLFTQDQDWKNQTESLNEARVRLDLSRKIESIQELKLKTERDRLSRGRTTTYQVLLFETDYLNAQITRIRDQAKVLTLIAQLKLFGESL